MIRRSQPLSSLDSPAGIAFAPGCAAERRAGGISRRAAAEFFLGVGRLREESEARCAYTAPLFPLILILDADGTLAGDCAHLLGTKGG